LEREFPELGIGVRDNVDYVTVPSLIATITDILVGKRLAFLVEDGGLIVGVQFLEDEDE
jgi:hypothetical protein